MNKYYLLHGDHDGCGAPLLMIKAEKPLVYTDKLDYHNIYHLDEITCTYGDIIGPCHFCGNPFSIHADYIIDEAEYRKGSNSWPENYKEVKHRALETGNYRGDGNEQRILSFEYSANTVRLKQRWPRGSNDLTDIRFDLEWPVKSFVIPVEFNKFDTEYYYAIW